MFRNSLPFSLCSPAHNASRREADAIRELGRKPSRPPRLYAARPPGYIKPMNGHARIDARLLALHEAVRARFLSNPAMVRRLAVDNLARWKQRGVSCRGYREWERILATASDGELAELLIAEGENADFLRQSTPFAGVLSEHDRTAIFRRYASR